MRKIRLTRSAKKYFEALDKSTRLRIQTKLQQISEDPFNVKNSYPLTAKTRRSSRVGGYRILLEVDEEEIVVAYIGSRGQIYRDA